MSTTETGADVALSDTENAINEPHPNSDSDSDTDSDMSSDDEIWCNDEDKPIEKWTPVIDAIITATRDAFPSSPTFSPDPTPEQATSEFNAFQTYWHSTFTSLLDKVNADETIPEFLTNPPVKRFAINLFTQSGVGNCPCCLPYVEPSILLENGQGLKKGNLIAALRDHLYGENIPEVYEYEDSEPMRGALVFGRDWMSSSALPNGEKRCHYAKCPKVWLYCAESVSFWDSSETERERWEKVVERAAQWKAEAEGEKSDKGDQGTTEEKERRLAE